MTVVLTYDPPLIAGRLIRRYKRFLAEASLADGREITAHCPNSGSMLGCAEPGSAIYLSASADPRRRTAYTWEMTQVGSTWVGINTLLANRLVGRLLTLKNWGIFRDITEFKAEASLKPGVRLDFKAQTPQGPLWIEVKNVSLVQDKVAVFPDARTERGLKHLRELSALARSGMAAWMIYVVLRADAAAFAPAAHIDPAYAEGFYAACAAGVRVLALQAEVSPTGLKLLGSLPLLG